MSVTTIQSRSALSAAGAGASNVSPVNSPAAGNGGGIFFTSIIMRLTMADLIAPVVPNRSGVSPLRYHEALVSGLARVAGKIGRGNLADKARSVVARYSAIIGEADALRGAA